MRRGRVLVVDDEPNIRATLSQILEDEGFVVDSVESGEEALVRLENRDYDVVLLDIWLPGRDGMELLEQILQGELPPQVIMITGHGTIETAVKATKLGAYDFLEKPLSLEKVVLTVRNAFRERRLKEENLYLKSRMFEEKLELVGESRAIQQIKQLIEEVAPTDGRVLIMGENGTGKELVAKLIHLKSRRRNRNFVAINCAAIPDELIESELFGYVRGAFTNALKDKKGKFQLADGGTLFLDEIADMSLKTQAKILRVIEEQRFEPLGSTESISIDTRIIAATNKDLKEQIKKGLFREDLYYRLNVIPIYIPPLRERKEDIIPLAQYYLDYYTRLYRREPKRFSDDAKRALLAHPWYGNVRELKNLMERIAILVKDEVVTSQHLNFVPTVRPEVSIFDSYEKLQEAREAFEKEFILRKLRENNWNISRTAQVLGVERSHLYRKLKYYGIDTERRDESKG